MVCPSCQASVTEDAVFCSQCGVRLHAAATGPTQRLNPVRSPNADDALGELRTGSCPKCGSFSIIPHRRLYPDNEHTGDLHVIQYERPDSVQDYGACVISVLRAWICGKCGYTEIYAKNPAELFEMYQHAVRQRRSGP